MRRDLGFTRDPRVILSGRQVLDGLALLRSAFVRLDDYRLETAAQAILGKGKLFSAEHRGHEIETAWRDDPARLVAYNLNDARLVRRDPRAHGAGRADGPAEPAHRHAARPRRRADRLGRLPLPRRAPRARPRGAVGPHRGRPGHRDRRGPRPRLGPRPLPEHPRLRLQEPVPEPHPHLQHRSADPRPSGPRGARACRSSARRAAPRSAPTSPASCPSWSPASGRSARRPGSRATRSAPRRRRSS